ncbi:hypothetical protein CDL15_Pgr018383 [Punica granatum]|uniref:Uncharacterized protein n=1 Tax=Punica granatum TaxID=22663 RepID=A0A218WJJ2_PUNGR|nr:hypothetical protein CDL15_Pgr018383 [Punica granatum]
MQQSRAGKRSAAGGVRRAGSKDTQGRGRAREVELGSRSTSSESKTLRSERGLESRFARWRSRGSEVARSSGNAERIVDGGAVEASSADSGGGRTEGGSQEGTKS